MTESEATRRSRWKDVWQLHLPLVVVLALCIALTVVEARRASEGVWRAWAYMFEWPLIGLFTIWIWNRYRKHGTVLKGLGDRWRAHVAAYGKAEGDEPAAPASAPTPATPQTQTPDADLDAWRGYLNDLHRRDPPGAPPAG